MRTPFKLRLTTSTLRVFCCLCYLSVTELSHFHLRQTTTLRFCIYESDLHRQHIAYKAIALLLSYHAPNSDVRCLSFHILLGYNMRHTTCVSLADTSRIFKIVCPVAHAHSLSIYIQAFDCGLTPVSLA